MTLGAGVAAEGRAERCKRAAVSQEFHRKSIILAVSATENEGKDVHVAVKDKPLYCS